MRNILFSIGFVFLRGFSLKTGTGTTNGHKKTRTKPDKESSVLNPNEYQFSNQPTTQID